MQDEPKSVASTSISILSLQILRYFLQFIYLVVMSKFLDPRAFGIVAIVLAISGVAVIFSDFGLSLASIRDRGLSQVKKTTLFFLNLAMGFILAALVALSAYPISIAMDERDLFLVTLAISSTFLITGLGVQHRVEFSLQRRLGVFAKLEFSAFLFSVIVGVCAAISGFGVWSLVFQQIAFPLAKTLLMLKLSNWRPSSVRDFRISEIVDMIKFGNSATMTTLLYFISTNLDTVLVGRFYGGREVGLYNRAFQLSNLPIIQFTAPLTRLFVPVFSESSKGPDFKKTVLRVQKYLGFVLLVPLSAIISLYQSWVPVLFGNSWNESTRYIWVLGIAAGIQSIGYVYYWIFLALGKPKLLLKAELPGRVLMFLLMFVGALFGSMYIAFAVVIGQAVMWWFTAYIQGPRTGFSARELLRELRIPMILAIISALACLVVDLALTEFNLAQTARALILLTVWISSLLFLWKLYEQDLKFVLGSLKAKSLGGKKE